MTIITAGTSVPCFAAPSQKAIEATQIVMNQPTTEAIDNYIKVMLKEYKRAYRAKCYEEAADYLRGALNFLQRTPDSELYKKAYADLENVLIKLSADKNPASRLELAKNIFLEGKHLAAAYEFTVLLNEGYQEDVCFEYLGEIAKELKEEEAAFVFFQKAVYSNPDNVSAKLRYANALMRKGMESDAIYFFEDVIRRTNSNEMVEQIIEIFKARQEADPDNENNYGVLGLAYQKLGQYDKTYKCLKHSLLLNPDDVFLRYYLGNLLFNIKEFNFADEIYSEILEENPYESQIRIARAKTYTALENEAKALNDYRVVLAMYPDEIQAQYGIYGLLKNKMPIDKIVNAFYPLEPNYKLTSDGYDNLGYLASKLGNVKDAIKFFEKSYQLNPKSETIYVDLYKNYQLTGASDKARAILLKGYKLFPNNQEILDLYSALTASNTDEKNDLALQYLNEGEYEKAIQIYNQIEPKTAQTYVAIANCYRQLGDLQNAVNNYKNALMINNSDSETYYSLGVTLIEGNNLAKAKVAFERALKYDVKNTKARKMLTYIDQKQIGKTLDEAYEFYQKGDYETALKLLDTAASNFPNDPKAFYFRGLTKQAMGNFAHAVTDYRTAIEIDRNYVDAYYNLGECLEKINKKKEALFMYEKFLGAENIDEELAKKAEQRVIELGERYY